MQPLPQLLPEGLGGGEGLLAQLLHLRIGHELLGVLHVLFRLAEALVGFHDGLQVGLLPKEPGRPLGVLVEVRLFGPEAELLIFITNALQFFSHGALQEVQVFPGMNPAALGKVRKL